MLRALPYLTLVLLASGCIEPSASEVEAPDDRGWIDDALPFGPDHDHADPLHHQAHSTPNFKVLGWDPLRSDHYGRTAGGYLCGDVAPSATRTLAITHGYHTDVALVVVDVTDLRRPTPLSEVVLPNGHARDIALDPSGRFAVIATLDDNTKVTLPEPMVTEPASPQACAARGPETEAAYPNGIVLVDLEDPTNPRIADYLPLPVWGAHSIHVGRVGDRPIVLASRINHLEATSFFDFVEVLPTAAGLRLQYLSSHAIAVGATTPLDSMAHTDGRILHHPATGQTLAYLAAWDQGVVIVDITDPLMPREIGRWNEPEDASTAGKAHEVLPLPALVDGRHLTFVGPELQRPVEGYNTGWVHVLDTTDPSAPTFLATWNLGSDVEWDARFQFSPHYFAFVDGTLFVTLYHGGMWAVDTTRLLETGALDTVGVFLPENVPPEPAPLLSSVGWSPAVLDVNPLPDGSLVIWEVNSGVYTVEFESAST